MTIETKYNIGDKVWILEDGKVYEREIYGVTVYHCRHQQYDQQSYSFVLHGTNYHKSDLYPTKADLLNSL